MRKRVPIRQQKITYFKGETDPLSNLYTTENKLHHRGLTFPSIEHIYQYRKCIRHHHPITAAYILNSKCTSRQAMQLGQGIKTNTYWRKNKHHLMLTLLEEKFVKSQNYRRAVIDSYPSILIENTSHPFWGQGPKGQGLNWMGTLHLQIRHKNFYKQD